MTKDWRLLLGASAVSTVGDGAYAAAIPLLAAAVTADPRMIALVTVCGTLPWLLVSLPTGAWADRHDGHRLMSATLFIQAFLVVLLALFHTGVAELCGVAFALGCAATVSRASGQALIPLVTDRLERANGQLNAVQSAGQQFLGPPLGSLLFVWAVPLPFWADAVTFAVAALMTARIAARTAHPARRPLWTEVGAGLRWLGGQRLLRTLSILAGVANLCNFLAQSTFVLFAKERLGVGGAGYGVLLSAMAVGGVFGGLLAPAAVTRIGGRTVATATLYLTPAAMLAIGVFGHDPVTVGVLATITSFGASMWNVASSSVRQRRVPREFAGRVSSVGIMIAWGTQPVGALLGGQLAWFGLAVPWLVAGTVRLIAATVALPALREWSAQ